jgi:hypothetical protein
MLATILSLLAWAVLAIVALGPFWIVPEHFIDLYRGEDGE